MCIRSCVGDLVGEFTGKIRTWMQKPEISRFCICVYNFKLFEISAKFQGFFLKFLTSLTVANEVQFIGKDFVAWRSQEYNHHMLGH